MRRLIGKPEPAWMIAAGIAGVMLLAAMFVPLWRMELVAPQYPEGLVMYAYGNRFEGSSDSYYDDVREINGLNHYIGMKPIEEVTEMDLFIPGLLATIAGGVVVGFIGWKKNWFRGLAIAGFWFVPLFFVADLQYWLYNYGHTLDENAALNTGAITPKVVGTTKVWNFHSENAFEVGFYLMVAAAIVISFLPPALRRLQASRRTHALEAQKADKPESVSAGAAPARRRTA